MSTTAEDDDDILDMEGQKHVKINIAEEYKCEDWAKCAQEKDVKTANRLLDNDILPNKEDLQLAFDNFNDDSKGKELLKDICKKIENHLMETNESITNVKGCYKHGDSGKKIMFVIQTTSELTDIDCQYIFRDKKHIVQENAQKEIENYKFKEKFNEANECLRIKSPVLMKSHSNLTGTSLSSVKLRRNQDPEPRTCIVLYVEAKGYVPVGEDPLPLHLEYDKDTVFKTDVRECQCAITTAGPCDKHEDLKIGCRIASSKVSRVGTLGGFIDHPDHGLCAITCAHVLLSDEEFEQIYKGNMDVKSLTTTECYQPMQSPDRFGEVCDIKLFEGNQTNGGMDVAFVKVDESRKPKTPSFPDIFEDDVKIPPVIDDFLRQTLRYDTGSVLQVLDLNKMKDNSQVFKYGFKTKLTSGSFRCSGVSRKIEVKGERKAILYTLNDLIEKNNGDCGQFSDAGDSGAMVFLSHENKELMALGILIGYDFEKNRTIVTPIWNILKEIKIPRPYQLAELRSTRKIIEELKRSSLSISKKYEDLTKVFNH